MPRNQTAPNRRRVSAEELSVFLESCPPHTRAVVRSLRSMVHRCAPKAAEAIRFRSLCYFKPEARFGAIGGNVCMIEARAGGTRLSFLHGASLRDPAGVLLGSGKAKRYAPIRTAADARRREIIGLVRAAASRARCAPGGDVMPSARARRRDSPPRE